MPPQHRQYSSTARLLRPTDLLDLTVGVLDGTVTRTPQGPVLDPGGDCLLVVDLAFQHLGEEAYLEQQNGPEPSGIATHRAARPSRLVFEVPPGNKVPWTTAGLLEALPKLRLRVVPLATPAGTRVGGIVGPFGPLTHDELFRRAIRDDEDELVVLGPRTVRRTVLGARDIRLARGISRRVAWPFEPGEVPRFRRPSHRNLPRAPRDDETALELPYRLVVSPSVRGAFVHDVDPMGAGEGEGTDRVQLWRTRLTTRLEDAQSDFTGHTDDPVQRVVRAIWTRDLEPPDLASDHDVTLMSMNPVDRRTLVRESASVHEGVTPLPFEVRRLHLSALGAWVDWRGAWDTDQYDGDAGFHATVAKISSYRHVAETGRDSYVRLAYPGHLFPFGHRAELIKLTERKVHEPTRTAYLRQRYFIVLREHVRQWSERDTPLTQVALEPTVTPDLDFPGDPVLAPFVPFRGGVPFSFDVLGTDRAGDPVVLSAPLVFVPDIFLDQHGGTAQGDVDAAYDPYRRVDARGQQVSFAASAAPGDTRLEANSLTWQGSLDPPHYTSRPSLQRANAVVPAMRHLAGQSPGVDLAFAAAYLAPDAAAPDALGFGPGNPSGLFLTLLSQPVSLDFTTGTDKAGGFVAPNLMVRALSRALGAVGDDGSTPGGLIDGGFDPATFLQGALPKLFGLFDLVELIEAVTGHPLDLGAAPAFVTEALDKVSAIVSAVQRLQAALEEARGRLDADLAQAIANGAHQGAQDAINAAKAALDNAATPILSALQHVADAFDNLLTQPDLDNVRNTLTALAALLDSLRTALDNPRIPVAARSAVLKPLGTLEALLKDAEDLTAAVKAAEQFVDNVLTPADGITARYDWRPKIGSWPATGDPVFRANDQDGFGLSVEVRASATKAPAVDVSAELRSFALELLPGEQLMRMSFSRIGFRVGSGTKPEVDVVFDGMEFLGALGFIETLRRMIPFDGFADPPYVDVGLDGVRAGFDLELPNVAVGVFSLENIALGADARVPFLGDAVTAGFYFCKKESPFRLTVMCIGGGGWVGIRLSPKGLVELEVGLEAAAALSVDFGVASGSVSIAVGVYLRLEADKGSLTGYFRIRGEVDVLGLISASITLELSLTYDFPTGKMIGRASIVVEVEVLFFSASVEISCERRLAGSKGDPVLAQIMPPDASGHNDAWSAYCAAFATGA